MTGRKITVFLIDGIATGLRTAELGLSTVKAIVVPRASLSAAKVRTEAQRTGVYILVGPDSDKPGVLKVYIGEGDSIITRLITHDKDPEKDFWSEAIAFVSKDDYVTKAHGRYLESRMIALARDAKRCTVTNGTEPSGEKMLPEVDCVDMEEFIAQARLLLGTLGFDLFSPIQKSSIPGGQQQVPGPVEFAYSGDGFDASLAVDATAGTFIVRKDSKARVNEADGMSESYRNLRRQLLASGVLLKEDGTYRFAQDYTFSSVTAAAQVVGGTSISGRTAWKLKSDGKAYAEWQDSQTPVPPPAGTS